MQVIENITYEHSTAAILKPALMQLGTLIFSLFKGQREL